MPTIVTERYDRTIDLSIIDPTHRPLVTEVIRNAEGAMILATPVRYMLTHGRAFIVMDESQVDGADLWKALIDTTDGTIYQGERGRGVLDALRCYRECAGLPTRA